MLKVEKEKISSGRPAQFDVEKLHVIRNSRCEARLVMENRLS